MSWRSSLIRRVAICAGLGVAIGLSAWWTLKSAEKRLHRRYETVKVLRARRYIAPGKAVTPDLVEETDIPSVFVEPTALASKSQLGGEDGRGGFRARAGLLKGEQVARSKLQDDSTALGLAWSLPAGQTAFSLRLPLERASGGFIEPGDWVHALCMVDRQSGWSEPRARLLLSRVQAIAVDRRTMRDGAAVAASGSAASDSILVTLSLAPRQAVALALAAAKGDVTLVLAAPLDAPVPGAAVTLKQLHGNF